MKLKQKVDKSVCRKTQGKAEEGNTCLQTPGTCESCPEWAKVINPPWKLKQRETGRQGVMRACEDLLTAERVRHFRMNAGDRFGSYKGKRWRIRGHAKGTPDLLMLPFVYTHLDPPHPLMRKAVVWIECKAPGKHPTAEQLQFGDEARNDGEMWLLVNDTKQLQDWLKENRAR